MTSRAGVAWPRRSRIPEIHGALLCAPLVCTLATLLVWPTVMLLGQSLRAADGGGWTLGHYAKLILDARLRAALLASLWLSLVVSVASTCLSLAPAWLLVRGTFRGKRLLRAILALPLAFSGLIVGFLAVIVLGRTGSVPRLAESLTGTARLAGSAYTFLGLCAAYLYFEIPRATLTLEAAVREMDFRLVDAARTLGAGRTRVLGGVILPALAPALLTTCALTFSVSLGSFGVVLILATRSFSVLPLEIFMAYLAFPSDRGAAAAMAVLLLVVALAVALVVRTALARAADVRVVEPRRPPVRA